MVKAWFKKQLKSTEEPPKPILKLIEKIFYCPMCRTNTKGHIVHRVKHYRYVCKSCHDSIKD